MDTVQKLTSLLEGQPWDDITAYLLVDALIEFSDYTPNEARRAVCRCRLAAWDARDLADAAALMRPGSIDLVDARRLISAACSTAPAPTFTVIVVAGDAAPVSVCEYKSNPGAWWYDWIVTVGATWLVKVMDTHRRIHPVAEKRRATRRAARLSTSKTGGNK